MTYNRLPADVRPNVMRMRAALTGYTRRRALPADVRPNIMRMRAALTRYGRRRAGLTINRNLGNAVRARARSRLLRLRLPLAHALLLESILSGERVRSPLRVAALRARLASTRYSRPSRYRPLADFELAVRRFPV